MSALSARAMLENPGLLIPTEAFASREAFERFCTDVRDRVAPRRPHGFCPIFGGSYGIMLDPDDESLTPNLRRDGFWESWTSVAIARHLRPGMRCVDVGANVGYFTLLMTDRTGEAGAVMAIEPQPGPATCLRASLSHNRLALRAWCEEIAAGASSDRRELMLYGDLHGSASFFAAPGWEITGRLAVPVQTLDDLLAGFPIPDFVKIDVEGAEVEVWDGMGWTIGRNPHLVLCMEICANRHYDLGRFLTRIQRASFPLRIVNDAGDLEDATVEQLEAKGNDLPMLWLQREPVLA